MSSCVIVHNKNNLIFASDTALSTYVDGAFYRVDSEYHKTIPYDNGWYFCSGTASTIELIRKRICDYGFDDIEQWLRINSKPSKDGIYDIELIQIDKYTNIVYQYSQYNNFRCVMHIPPVVGFNIVTSGYQTKALFSLVYCGMQKSLDITKIIIESYSKICDECVGGSIDLNVNGKIENIPLTENVKYVGYALDQLLVATEFVESGHISGSSIVGSRIGIGQYQDGHYCFEVDSNGKMVSKQGAFIDGKLESCTILSPIITNGNFTVDSNGMICNNAKIGGWLFDNSSISANNITFSLGAIDGKTWHINANGEADFRSCNLSMPTTRSYVGNTSTVLGTYLDGLVSGSSYINTISANEITIDGTLTAKSGEFTNVSSDTVTATTAQTIATRVFGILCSNFISAATVNANYIESGSISVDNLVINATNLKSTSVASQNDIYKASWDKGSKIYASSVTTTNIYYGGIAYSIKDLPVTSSCSGANRMILASTQIN